MDPGPRSILLGPPGTFRDLVGAVLTFNGIPVETPRPGLLPPEERQPGCALVLVDPGAGEWDAARRLGCGVVLVAQSSLGEDDILEAVLLGADAIVRTDASPLELGRAVEAVSRGGTLLDPAQARRLAQAARSGRAAPPPALQLTPREVSIVESIERGESVKQTARSLGIAVKTVENLQSRLFRKLGAHNRAHAVTLVHRLGLLEGPETATPESAEG